MNNEKVITNVEINDLFEKLLEIEERLVSLENRFNMCYSNNVETHGKQNKQLDKL